MGAPFDYDEITTLTQHLPKELAYILLIINFYFIAYICKFIYYL